MTDDTFVNAVLGAVVTVLLSFTVVSPVIGGGVAAWLEAGSEDESIRVGAISGAIVGIPLAVLVLLGVAFLAVGVAVFFLLVVAGLTVGMSALGGYLAWYLVDGDVLPESDAVL